MLTVSNYHYIRENFDSAYPSIFGLTPSDFNNQLNLLAQTGEFISPPALIENIDEILDSHQNHILITFDDGLREQFELGKPVLESFGIKAAYFVNSINFTEGKVSQVHKIHLLRSILSPLELMSAFGQASAGFRLAESEIKQAEAHYNYDDPQSARLKFLLNFKLSPSEVSALVDPLFDAHFDESAVADKFYFTTDQLRQLAVEGSLGSHAHSHIALGLHPEAVIENELKTAADFLQSIGASADFISYPYGNAASVAPPVWQTAKKLGHKIGFTTERGINQKGDDHLLLKRFDCNDLPGGKNYGEWKSR